MSLHTVARAHPSLPKFVRALLALTVLLLVPTPAAARECARPQNDWDRRICEHPDVRETAAAMPVALHSMMTRFSASEFRELAARQRDWRERWLSLICAADQYTGPDIDCLRHKLDERLTALRDLAAVAASTPRACSLIAALANRGARALRSADLVGRNRLVDLRNDGNPRKLVQRDQGTAHVPYLANEADEAVEDAPFGDSWDTIRWAYEIAVVRIAGRIWEVRWDVGTLDDTAVLSGATDGSAVCLFRHKWLRPTLKILHDGQGSEAALYQGLLLGSGQEAPSAKLDDKAVAAASDQGMFGLGGFFTLGRAWRVDLLRSGHPMTLIRVVLSSGAGRGCDFDELGLVQGGRVVAFNFRNGGGDPKPIATTSPTFGKIVDLVPCEDWAQTPILDRAGRAYILIDNMAKHPDAVERIRLLAAARHGFMQALARLSWQARNRVTSAAGPAWKAVVRFR